MAVRFLLGPAGSGKTQYCLDRLRNLEREGRPGIYLVPEQFTFSADRELLGPPDLHGLRHVRVLSFTRFAWWMRERAGEALLPTVDSAVRPMILRSVLERMNPEVLGPLASMRGRPGVLLQLSRFVGEVRNHGPIDFLDAIEVSRLELTARSVDPDRSSADAAVAPAILQKLHSLAEVYGAYATRLREMKRLDPEEQLFGLEPLLAADSGLPDLTIYVDGFLSWTRREAELLAALAKHGVALEIALCCDPRERELPRVPFRPVWRSLEQVSSRFGRAGVTVEESRTFPGDHPTRFRAALLSDIERRLYPHVLLEHAEDEAAPEPVPQSDSEAARAGKTPSSTDNGSGEDGGDRRGADERANDDGAGDNSVNDVGAVRMLETRDRRQEVVAWARQIDRWIRLDRDPVERGAIAVLVRDVDPYRDLVREIFGRYEIPYFLDERRSVLAQVRVRLLLGSLEVIASEWRREAVIALLRNPVLGHAPAVVDLLENLSLEYGRNYERWYDETWFEYSHPPRARYHDTQDDLLPEVPDEKQPDDADEEESEVEQDYESVREEAEEQRRVGLTEPARRRTLLPLARLERRWRTESWTGKQAVREVRAFLDGLDALSDRDRPDSVSSPHAEWDDRVRQSLEDLLDEMEQIWSDLPVTVEEFARTLREGLLALRLGVTPIRQDQVLVGDVQRSRVHGLRRVIVGGVNDGVFPRAVADDPVLGERDRAALVQLGVPLGPTAEERQEEEAYLFYIAMTRASEQVVLTWTRLDPHGKETPPSPLLEELVDAVPGIERAEEVLSDPDELALGKVQTPRELGGKLLAHLSKLWHERSHAREAERQDAERQDAERQEEDRLVEAALAVVHPEMEPRALLTEPMEAPDLLSTPTEPWPRNEEGHGPSFVREKGAPARELAPERSRLDPSIGVERSLLEAQREFARGSTALLLPRPEHLPADLIDELYPGSRLVSSVSRLQEFAACPFQSFARGSLGLTTRPEARVTPLETGTLAHAALDRFFESGVDRDQVSGRLRDVFEELAPLPEFQGFRLDDASRFRWDSTRRALDRFLTMELARLGASPYRVIARERSFGMGSGSDSLPGLELPLSGGRLLVLRGQIDRMDARTDRVGVHVLVIDYKRTARSGLPATLEAGVDLQLATYLIFARDVAGMVPAGGLYVPVVPSPPRRERLQDSKDNRLGIRAHGFVLEEEAAGIDGGLGFLVRRGPQRLAGEDRMNELLEVARQYLTTYGATMARGWIAPRPLLRESRLPCERCDFGTVCRYRPGRDPRRRNALEGMVSTDPHEEASAVSGESAS